MTTEENDHVSAHEYERRALLKANLELKALRERAERADWLEQAVDTWRALAHHRHQQIERVQAEIDNLKTTLTEDLAYQEKLEAKIERVEALANEYTLQGDDVYSEDILAALEGDA